MSSPDMNLDQYTSCFPSAGSAKTTCRQCRLRKVRCDGRDDGCGNCARLSFTCSLVAASSAASLDLEDDSTEELVVQLRPKRRRGSRACTGCRKMKVRCSGTLPHCTTCERRGVVCHYPVLKRQAAPGAAQTIGVVPARASIHVPTAGSVSPSNTANGLALDSPVDHESHPLGQRIPQLVDRFFARSYPVPCYSFLHPASTKERARYGRLEKVLAFAVCGVATLHSGHGERSRREDSSSIWIRMAEQLVWQHLDSPSIPGLQALLLIVNYRMETGSFQKAFMLSSLAARAAVSMGLNRERPDLPFVAQETRRRMAWSLRLLDRYFSAGLTEFELCGSSKISLQLPSHEVAFADVTSKSHGTTSFSETDDLGTYRLFVRLEAVRRDIMRLNSDVRSLAQPADRLAALLRELGDQLADIGAEMPVSPVVPSTTSPGPLDNQWLARHVAVHLSWHQCHCDLHRLAVAGYPEAAPNPVLSRLDERLKSNAESICVEHAHGILRILSALDRMITSPPLLEYDTAICAYHALRLFLFLSRLRSQPSDIVDEGLSGPGSALGPAELCLAALKRLFPSSPLVKPVIDNIEKLASETPPTLPSPSLASQYRGSSFRDTSPTTLVEVTAATSENEVSAGHDPLNSDAQMSWAERNRQKLAIQSLLRQSDLSDDEDEEINNDLFETKVAARASTRALSDASLTAMAYGYHVREMTPPDTLAARAKSPSLAGWGAAGEDGCLAEHQAPRGHSPQDGRQRQPAAVNKVAATAGPDTVNEHNGDLQFPLFPWFAGRESHTFDALFS